MKKQINILLVGLASVFMSCSDVEEVSALYPEYEEVKELSIVDKNATSETKVLYSNLWAIQSKGFMFGHHDDLGMVVNGIMRKDAPTLMMFVVTIRRFSVLMLLK